MDIQELQEHFIKNDTENAQEDFCQALLESGCSLGEIAFIVEALRPLQEEK